MSLLEACDSRLQFARNEVSYGRVSITSHTGKMVQLAESVAKSKKQSFSGAAMSQGTRENIKVGLQLVFQVGSLGRLYKGNHQIKK